MGLSKIFPEFKIGALQRILRSQGGGKNIISPCLGGPKNKFAYIFSSNSSGGIEPESLPGENIFF